MSKLIQLYPLKFKPILKELIWGGNRICPYKGIESKFENIGESWEVSDLKSDSSKVKNGILKGQSLNSLINIYKELLVGEAVYQRFGDSFPLLIKFIDAAQDLSIQVHPNDEVARKQHQANGKTEFWYVIDAKESTSLYAGFNKATNETEVKEKIENHSICTILNEEHVNKNDAFFIPAGRIHAIKAGAFIIEIQQNSNTTYRIWDYNRLDKNGKKRNLDVDLALDCIDYKFCRNYKTNYKRSFDRAVKLQECRYFTVNLIEAESFIKFNNNRPDSFIIWVCIEGQATYSTQRKHNGQISQGETIMFPACDLPLALITNSEKSKIIEVYIAQ